MKTITICLIALLGAYAADASYVGSWNVLSECATGCCCPKQGASVSWKDGDNDELTLAIDDGEWEGCDDYGWTAADTLELLFNDDTEITTSGIEGNYVNEAGVEVSWLWRPQISEDGKFAWLNSIQGDESLKCGSILAMPASGDLIKAAFGLLMVVALFIAF